MGADIPERVGGSRQWDPSSIKTPSYQHVLHRPISRHWPKAISKRRRIRKEQQQSVKSQDAACLSTDSWGLPLTRGAYKAGSQGILSVLILPQTLLFLLCAPSVPGCICLWGRGFLSLLHCGKTRPAPRKWVLPS